MQNASQKIITLTSFVDQVNNYVRNFKELTIANADDIIKYIQETTYPNFIGINYEHLSCLENSTSFRVILSTKRNKANFSTPLVRECNGAIIIIEQDTKNVRCRLITRPANDCNPKVNDTRIVNNGIRNGLYDIYRIDDGTTVNISHLATDGGKWIFSSKNSFDLENVEWRGRKYGEILAEVFKVYSGFALDKLNTSKTYTIGFRHPAYHPFGGSNEMSAWFIQSADIRTGVISTTDAVGLPTQERARIISQGGKYWQAMQAKANSALEEYVTSVQKRQPIRPLFGFILRSKDKEKTRYFSDILIESTLLNEIRNAVYQAPYIANKTLLAEYKNNFKNTNFVQIESYLDTQKRALYEILFPQWSELYRKYDEVVALGIDQVFQLLTADPHGTNWVCADPPTAIDKFVVALAPLAGAQISTEDESAKKLIHALVIRPKNVDKFVSIFDNIGKN